MIFKLSTQKVDHKSVYAVTTILAHNYSGFQGVNAASGFLYNCHMWMDIVKWPCSYSIVTL